MLSRLKYLNFKESGGRIRKVKTNLGLLAFTNPILFLSKRDFGKHISVKTAELVCIFMLHLRDWSEAK